MESVKGKIHVVRSTNNDLRPDDPHRERIGLVVEVDGCVTTTVWLLLSGWSWMIGHVSASIDAVIEHEDEAKGGEAA